MQQVKQQLLSSPETREELYYSRRARFELNKYINLDNIDDDTQWTNGRKTWNYLDYLMEQIPGIHVYKTITNFLKFPFLFQIKW